MTNKAFAPPDWATSALVVKAQSPRTDKAAELDNCNQGRNYQYRHLPSRLKEYTTETCACQCQYIRTSA